MNTILVWLLVSMPMSYTRPVAPQVVERFAQKDECERVAKYLATNGDPYRGTPRVGCIQATIVK